MITSIAGGDWVHIHEWQRHEWYCVRTDKGMGTPKRHEPCWNGPFKSFSDALKAGKEAEKYVPNKEGTPQNKEGTPRTGE